MIALMFQPFRRMFDFRGRARRNEWALFVLLQLAVVMGGLVFGVRLMPNENLGDGLLALPLAYMAVFGLPMLALQVRRLHDSDKSGWWVLVSMIPYFGLGAILWLMLQPGIWGPNRFGNDPRRSWDGDLFE
jgi:uncharacterized membrane protein YhaH (DUF805 family)